MYIITRKVTRPNTSLEFRNMLHESISVDVKRYWVENYKNTGKCITVNAVLSDDQLSMVTTMIWDNKESWNEYQNDPVFLEGLFGPIHSYQNANGFTAELVSEEEI